MPGLRWATPDFSSRGEGHLGAVRQFNGRRANGIHTGEFAVWQHRQTTTVGDNKTARRGLVAARQRVQHACGGNAQPVHGCVVQRQGDLFVRVTLQFNTGHAGNVRQILFQALRHVAQFGNRTRTADRKNNGRNINQAVVQNHLANVIREIQARPVHGLADTVPGGIGIVDGVVQAHVENRHTGAGSGLGVINLLHLAQLVRQWLQHQPLNGFGAGAWVVDANQTGAIGK